MLILILAFMSPPNLRSVARGIRAFKYEFRVLTERCMYGNVIRGRPPHSTMVLY